MGAGWVGWGWRDVGRGGGEAAGAWDGVGGGWAAMPLTPWVRRGQKGAASACMRVQKEWGGDLTLCGLDPGTRQAPSQTLCPLRRTSMHSSLVAFS